MNQELHEDYLLIDKIGEGSFGEVYLAQHKVTKKNVAIKVIDLEASEEDLEDIQSEIRFLSECKSPYTVEYYGSFLKDDHLHIVMEYLGGGSIAEQLNAGPISETQISVVVREVLHGLAYLHADGRIHRDIKAANILIALDGAVKLADFGVSGHLVGAMKRYTIVGSPYWMAPEVITEAGTDQKADIWSLGITCIEMTKGVPPFAELPPMHALVKIPRNEPPKLEGGYSPLFKDFVACCLIKDPLKRPAAASLLEHEFIKKNVSLPVDVLKELIERYDNYKSKHPRSKVGVYAKKYPQKKQKAANDADWDLDSMRAANKRIPSDEKLPKQPTNAAVSTSTASTPVNKNNVSGAEQTTFSNVVLPALKKLHKEDIQEPKVKEAIEQLQSALTELEKTCSGITVSMVHSLMDALQQHRTSHPLSGSTSRRTNVPTTTVNHLLNRWETKQFPKEQYLKYLVYLRQQQDESEIRKTLRKAQKQ